MAKLSLSAIDMEEHMQANRLIGIMNEIICCDDLTEVLRLARPHFGNPMILSNVSYSVVAITQEDQVKDPDWNEIERARCIPISSLACADIAQTFESSRLTGGPEMDCAPAHPLPMLRKTLVSCGRVVGYLNAPLYFGIPSQEQKDFFNLLGNLLAVRMGQRCPDPAADNNGLEYFVFDLLEGRITDPVAIRDRLHLFGWDPMARGKVHIVSIHWLNKGMDSLTEFSRLVGELNSIFPSCRVFSYGTEIKMVCPAGMNAGGEGESFHSLERLLDRESVTAGVSRPLRYLEHISDFNQQAKKAAELGYWLEPGRALHFFDHLSIYYALELAAQYEPIDQFIHSSILLLWDYDEEHDTTLLNTLEIYLTHNQSIGESAAALYIHRNTMNYRISKIIELTHLNLADASVVTQLLFSFYTLRYHQMTGKGSQVLPGDSAAILRKRDVSLQ